MSLLLLWRDSLLRRSLHELGHLLHHVHHGLILHDVSFFPVLGHADLGWGLSVQVVFGVIVTFFSVVDSSDSNCLVVVVVAAVERVLGLGATGCHLVGQALKLVALTACVL